MLESLDPQSRHAEALECHDHLISSLRADIDGFQLAANKLQMLLQEVSPVLQHAALSLRHLNPTATNAISALLAVAEALPKDVTQHTTRLHEWIKAIPEPPAPPADDEPANEARETEPVPESETDA